MGDYIAITQKRVIAKGCLYLGKKLFEDYLKSNI